MDPMARSPKTRIHLQFAAEHDVLESGKRLREGLSGVTGLADTLWVASDETLSVERLDRTPDTAPTFAQHATFPLEKLVGLPNGSRAEADLEDLDLAAGYLWLVGSHAAEREMPSGTASPRKVARVLGKVKRQGNRCLLARIPVVQQDATWTLRRRAGQGARKRIAARLVGDAQGNALTRALAKDDLLGPSLALPGKENGFDIEGLAVVGDRVLLGLRGPVLNEWACILEVEPRPVRNHPSRLELARFGRGKKRYRRHFLRLDGLGIRALCRQGLDLLVLAGPTAALDGPMRVYRWIGGARVDVERRVRAENVIAVMDLPAGDGTDHPEGIAVVPGKDGRDRLLVVYERAARTRFRGAHGVDADLLVIPA